MASSNRKVFFATFAQEKVHQCEGNPRLSCILDPTPWILDSRYWIRVLYQWNLVLRIPIVRGIPDSLSCIPDSKAQDSGFHSKTSLDSESHQGKSYGFRNLDSLT